jgi:uncharacterized membrane protein
VSSPGGLIYVVIAVLWAVVLLPMWLRRHDEVTESRSVDRFQGAMRTLSRRTPSVERREVFVPRRESSPRTPDNAAQAPSPASVAAARRRLVGFVLAGLTTLVLLLGLAHLLPLLATVVPLLLLLLFVAQARGTARRQRESDLAARRARASTVRNERRMQAAETLARPQSQPARPARQPAPQAQPAAQPQRSASRESVAVPQPVQVEQGLVAAEGFYDAESLRGWDPVPVPLPTYVSAAKAPRSVRVIDLTQPGSWTSGRTERTEPEEVALQAAAEAAAAAVQRDTIVTGEVLVERRRAVGD